MDIAIQEGSFALVPIPGEAEGTMAGFYFRFTDEKTGIALVAPIPFDQAVELGRRLAEQGELYKAGPVEGATPAPGIVQATESHLRAVEQTVPKPGSET